MKPEEVMISISKYAIEWRIGNCVIRERYNKEGDLYNRGHPYPASKNEPIYGIHQIINGMFASMDNFYYSKSCKEFIMIGSPSNRSDEDIVDTSFTLEEAVKIVTMLNKEKIKNSQKR